MRSLVSMGPDATLARLAMADTSVGKYEKANLLNSQRYAISLLAILDKLQSRNVLDPSVPSSALKEESELTRFAKTFCIAKSAACFEALVRVCYCVGRNCSVLILICSFVDSTSRSNIFRKSSQLVFLLSLMRKVTLMMCTLP